MKSLCFKSFLGCLLFMSQLSCAGYFGDITHYYLENQPQNLTIIDMVGFKKEKFQGQSISELSDLAWDHQHQKLMVINDKGRLFHFEFIFNKYKIKSIKPIFVTQLKDKKGKPLRKNNKDSEGLLLRQKKGQTELVISFEKKAKVVRFTPQGDWIKAIKLPAPLNKDKNYIEANKKLEAITLHPKYGLISAPEYPLKKKNKQRHTLYSLDGKHQWSFMASARRDSGITALEITPKGNILVLERAWQKKKALLTIDLKEVVLLAKGKTKVKMLAHFSSDQDWPIDNFEGLTRLNNNFYLMVSDDGKTALQQTLFMLFRL